jgi:hypothetical protein
MKQLIGGIAGALITGVAILGWNGRATERDTSWADARVPGAAQLVSDRVTADDPATPDPTTAALSVTCEPGQRAVVRRVAGLAGTTFDTACTGGDDYAALPAARSIAPLSTASGVRAVPVAYSSPRVAPARSVRYDDPTPERRVEHRSWQKRALVIGGSAGAGAGVGAIAGGKKGALIGAAIGGGAGTLYEVLKH